ncbi:MAG: caleosin family protein [Myxococcales bacterium]
MSRANLPLRAVGDLSLRVIGFHEHLAFFDENQDRMISPRESRRGLERLGFGTLLSAPAALAINFGVAGLSLLQGRALDPRNLALPATGFVRHPDTELVDDEGGFDEATLDYVFRKYGRTFDGVALTLGELCAMIASRVATDAARSAKDMLLLPAGATAVAVEWGALFWVAATSRQGKRVLERDTVRRFYTDPQFFHDVAQRIELERERRSQTSLGQLRNKVQDWIL